MIAALVLSLAAGGATPAPDYRQDAAWLCRPGRADVCADSLAATGIGPDGRTVLEPSPKAARNPPADCFYVYPTVSFDPGANSDLVPGREEAGMTAAQFAPFRSLCRTFAPIYRQVTLAALRARMRGQDLHPDPQLAYADVRAAWREYLTRDNRGRPFVLIGHSQGSILLKRLVAEEIDDKPVADRMLSAILPGTVVLVPRGESVGGDFHHVPPCTAAGQTGCVLSWASFRDSNPPPANALFGRTSERGMEPVCTNPAALGGGAAPLDPLLGAPWWRNGSATYEQPEPWTAQAKPLTTRYVRLESQLSGACTGSEDTRYLAVHITPGAAGDTVEALLGEGALADRTYPDWGFHVIDMGLVMGDLLRRVREQEAAFERRR